MSLGRFTEYNIEKIILELQEYKKYGHKTIPKKDLLSILEKIEYSWAR
jgi:hypothetical protein